MDFGAFTLDDDIESVIKKSLEKDLAVKDIEEFEKSLKSHSKVLYLVDNTGENISILNDNGYFDYCEDEDNPFDAYSNASYVKDSLLHQEEDFTFDDYLYYRNTFLTVYDIFLNGDYEELLCNDYPEDAEDIRETFEYCRIFA